METVTNDKLFEQARNGDRQAIDQLLASQRSRLRKMVQSRMDRRLARRIDASDVVQEAMITANQQIADYLQNPRIDFYPWLRDIAWNRLIDLHRKHISANRRSVTREMKPFELSDASVGCFAQFATASASGPVNRLVRKELRERVHSALSQLSDNAREVLLLRFLEQLTAREMAQVVGISESAVKGRLLRAIERLREKLDGEFGGITK